jgi:hypothetical protein
MDSSSSFSGFDSIVSYPSIAFRQFFWRTTIFAAQAPGGSLVWKPTIPGYQTIQMKNARVKVGYPRNLILIDNFHLKKMVIISPADQEIHHFL